MKAGKFWLWPVLGKQNSGFPNYEVYQTQFAVLIDLATVRNSPGVYLRWESRDAPASLMFVLLPAGGIICLRGSENPDVRPKGVAGP